MKRKDAYKFTRADAADYEAYLGSVLFEPYGQYVASQIQPANLSSVIELACGTGRVTEQLYKVLPKDVEFWATDLSNDMLAIAKSKLSDTGIKFQMEDIASLSYPDHSFDLIVCQFGMMFLPDKQKGFDEMYRVLNPGGRFICLTWDKVEHNPLSNLLINELIVPISRMKTMRVIIRHSHCMIRSSLVNGVPKPDSSIPKPEPSNSHPELLPWNRS